MDTLGAMIFLNTFPQMSVVLGIKPAQDYESLSD